MKFEKFERELRNIEGVYLIDVKAYGLTMSVFKVKPLEFLKHLEIALELSKTLTPKPFVFVYRCVVEEEGRVDYVLCGQGYFIVCEIELEGGEKNEG